MGLPHGSEQTWTSIARATLRCRADLLSQSQTRWSVLLFRPPPNPALLHLLARSFLCCEPDSGAIVRSAGIALGHPWRWLRPVAGRFVESFGGLTRPRHNEVVDFLRNDPAFQRAWDQRGDKIAIHSWMTGPQPMLPAKAARKWDLPAITSKAELAAWLNLTNEELDWYADLKGINRKQPDARLVHYHYIFRTKKSGKIRLIEAPKQHLRMIQRRKLAHILDRVPTHPAAHGFVKGRSIRTFASPHVGHAAVLRMDLEEFFPRSPRGAFRPSFGRSAIRNPWLTFSEGYAQTRSILRCGTSLHSTRLRGRSTKREEFIPVRTFLKERRPLPP